jgi:hypothetical protein
MKPTKERLHLLKSGNVFDGLEGIKNPAEKRRIECSRHNKLLEMIGSPKIDPVKWAKGFMLGHTKKEAIHFVEEILKSLVPQGEPHPINKPFFESSITKKNIEFYLNVYGYIRNHYV